MAAIKIDPNEYLNAAAEMHNMIAEANEVLMRSAYMVRENVDRCYSVDLPGHEPYTNALLSLMQQCENYAKEIEKQMQIVEKYREYLDECFIPIMPIPDFANLFEG